MDIEVAAALLTAPASSLTGLAQDFEDLANRPDSQRFTAGYPTRAEPGTTTWPVDKATLDDAKVQRATKLAGQWETCMPTLDTSPLALQARAFAYALRCALETK